jgi:HSP20 family protein
MSAVVRWAPVRWDPFREMEELGERFNRLVGQRADRRESGQEALTVADWIPKVDIVEDEKEFLIKAELPEVDKQDVKVTIQQGILTIQGERKREKEENGTRIHRVECSYGTFVRAFTLPEEVAESELKAEFKDGVLMIHLPKVEKPKPQAVEIKVA